MVKTAARKAGRKARRVAHYAGQYLYDRISDGLNRVYGLSDPILRERAVRSFYLLACLHALALEAGRRGHALIASGAAALDERPLRVAFVGGWQDGQRKPMAQLQHLLFGDHPVALEPRADFPLCQARRQAEALAGQADLIAVSSSDLLAWRPARGDWASGPGGIRMVFDYRPGEAWEAVEPRVSHNSNRRKVRNSGLAYRMTRREADFHDFYNEMHLPMVKERHKDYGDVLNQDGLLEVFRRSGALLQIVDGDGTVLGGALHYVNNRVLYGLINGVRGGDTGLIRRGVLLSVYYFGLKWGLENGMRRFDAGVCLPFSTNGLFRHKQDWGFGPTRNWWRPYTNLFWAPNCAPAALDWLSANPFVPGLARWGGPHMGKVYGGWK